MDSELREFIYLDSLSVKSLLASQQLAIPETVRDVSEEIHEDLDSTGWGFSLGYEGVVSLSRESDSGEIDETHRLAETERRVNDQFLFSILHRTLMDAGELIDLDEREDDDDLTFNSGDVIKTSGSCQTDPLYRVFNTLSSLMRITDLEEIADQGTLSDGQMHDPLPDQLFENMTDVLHGESLSLRMDSDSYHRPIAMSLDISDLWTDRPEREFIDAHDYTVVGRVSHVLPRNSKWDFVEILRIMDSVFSDESVDNIREMLVNMTDKMNESTPDQEEGEEFEFDVDAEREDFVIEESTVIIDPIAVYW